MKKALFVVLAAGLLGLGSVAKAQVSSVNVVGYYQLNMAPLGAFTMCSLQFDAIDPTNATLLGVFGTNNLKRSNSPAAADKVYLWDTASSQWQGFFQKSSNSLFYTVDTIAVTNPALTSGTAFFIQSWPSTPTNKVVTLSGEVVAAATNSVSIPGSVSRPFTALAYPFTCGTTLQGMSLRLQGKASAAIGSADWLHLWDPQASQYVQYWLRSNATGRAWQTNPTNAVDPNPSIQLGEAFFYQARTNLTWVETNAYLNSL